MLRARQLLPALCARLESPLSTSLQQQRDKISVAVPNNQVDKALKTLTRKLVQGRVMAEWKARAWRVRPAQQRVLDAKETARRLARKRFKAVMATINARQAQGF